MEEAVSSSFFELGKYGTVGVYIALIALCAFTIHLLYKFATNHIQHSNEIFSKGIEAQTKLKDATDRNSEILKDLCKKL